MCRSPQEKSIRSCCRTPHDEKRTPTSRRRRALRSISSHTQRSRQQRAGFTSYVGGQERVRGDDNWEKRVMWTDFRGR
uniref:Uncharacterized protein n=1 Tax=Globisporangium ultimum (strain ATCC 200006 / CBS 805.95 / DAOM BR144) TaxID=431595 RepID=K3WJD4_GLOUD